MLSTVKKKVFRDMTSMAVKDQHTPLTLELKKHVIMRVNKIFHNNAFVRVTKKGSGKKGFVFEVVSKYISSKTSPFK